MSELLKETLIDQTRKAYSDSLNPVNKTEHAIGGADSVMGDAIEPRDDAHTVEEVAQSQDDNHATDQEVQAAKALQELSNIAYL